MCVSRQTLEQHSRMLGEVANEVLDWCCDPDCTTADAVRLLKADYMDAKAELLRQQADAIRRRVHQKYTTAEAE